MDTERLSFYSPKENQTERELHYKMWWGGFLEAGGGIGFEIMEKKGREYAYPYVHYTDTKLQRVNLLNELIAGKVTNHMVSYEWRLRGGVAADFIQSLDDIYVPSRRDFIEAIGLWESAGREDRVEIARSFPASRRTQVTPEEYSHLCNNLSFLGGIFDSRMNGYSDYQHHTLSFATANLALAQALADMLNVDINYRSKNAAYISIDDSQYIRSIADYVQPYMYFRDKLDAL